SHLCAYRAKDFPGHPILRTAETSHAPGQGRGGAVSTTIFTDRHSRVDWLQLVALAGLMAIGVAFVFSATTSHEGASTAAWYDQLWVRQIIWCFAGVSAAAVLCLVD